MKNFLLVVVSLFFFFSCTTAVVVKDRNKSPYESYPDLDKMVVKIVSGYNLGIEDTKYPNGYSNPVAFFPGVPGISYGSGLCISKDGLIVTNRHVVAGYEAILVKIPGDTVFFPAKVLFIDNRYDIAFIYTGQKTEYFYDIITNNNKKPIKGAQFSVIGYPLDQTQEEPSISAGIFSRILNDKMTGHYYYQTDASINHGNSGGPVFDAEGKFTGIAFAKSNATAAEGYGLIIPVSKILSKLGDIKNFKQPEKKDIDLAQTLQYFLQGYPSIMVYAILQEQCNEGIPDVCILLSSLLWNSFASTSSESHSLQILSYHYFLEALRHGYNEKNSFVSRMEFVENDLREKYLVLKEDSPDFFSKPMWYYDDKSLDMEKETCLKGSKESCRDLAVKLQKTYDPSMAQQAKEIFAWLHVTGFSVFTGEYLVSEAEKMAELYEDFFNTGRVGAFHLTMGNIITLFSSNNSNDADSLPKLMYLTLLKDGAGSIFIKNVEDIKSKEIFRLSGHIELLRKGNPKPEYYKYINSAENNEKIKENIRQLIYEATLLSKRFLIKDESVKFIINDLKRMLSAAVDEK